jgi:hypothetical protein
LPARKLSFIGKIRQVIKISSNKYSKKISMKMPVFFTAAILLLGIFTSAFSQSRPLVPGGFQVPEKHEGDHFRIRTLIAHDVVDDHSNSLQGSDPYYGLQIPALDMPVNDFPTQEDIWGYSNFQKRFQKKSSFNYPVVSRETGKLIGFVYINHSRNPEHDAEVIWWLRTNDPKGELYQSLSETLKDWLTNEWPFKNPSFIGQAIPL